MPLKQREQTLTNALINHLTEVIIRLLGKTALITAAGQGIGRACALAMNDKRPFCRRWGTAVSAVGVEGIAWAHRAFENKPAAYRHSPKPLNTSQSVV